MRERPETGSAGTGDPPRSDDPVEHLFRRQWSRITAAVVRALGPAHLDLAEEVAQEALARAVQTWRLGGVPRDSVGWLVTVARNHALDLLKRNHVLRGKQDALRAALETRAAAAADPSDATLAGEIRDDELRLVLLCCHPELPRDQRLALTLKVACGFGTGEIARALLTPPPTVAQWIVRAKRRLRDVAPDIAAPVGAALAARLDVALEVCYLLFNEGYGAHAGEDLVRGELVSEALRLVEILSRHSETDRPATHALFALMLFQAARLPVRVDARGELVLLANQDRSGWDNRMIARAFRELERSARGDSITRYHHQAAIAACHAAAPSVDRTDWPAIVEHYDALLAQEYNPVAALNRAVAVLESRGPEAALREVETLEREGSLREYYLLFATRGEILSRLGEKAAAEAAFRAALQCSMSEPERRFLAERRAAAGR